MNKSTFLDIDESIITKNLTFSDNSNSEKLELDMKPFFIIQPTPGICIKTKNDDGEKVFLNICTTDKIPTPIDISDAELFRILSEENPQFTIPMSIGHERIETDKGGSSCLAYDVAINTIYFEKCQKNKNFLLFTISVIMDGVSNKFNKNLSTEDYVILKNRRVMGKLQEHRIENRQPRISSKPKKPLIEEIKASIKSDLGSKDKISESKIDSSETTASLKSDYVLLKQPLKGEATHLIGLFQIPKGVSSEGIEVLLDESRIVITVTKTDHTYDLSVPYIINVELAKCFLDKGLRVLRVDMPVDSTVDNIQTI